MTSIKIINQNNEIVALNTQKGKRQIVAMIYTHCLHTCPIIVSSLQYRGFSATHSK